VVKQLSMLAIALLNASAAHARSCDYDPAHFVRYPLVDERGAPLPGGPREVALHLQPGGTAEYVADGTCTILTFTGMRNSDAVYTDDGLGRGLTVVVGQDGTLTVIHAAGWIAKSK